MTDLPHEGCDRAPRPAPSPVPPEYVRGLATDRPEFRADLEEVVRLFPEDGERKIETVTRRDKEEYFSLVTVNGVTFQYVDRAERAESELARKRYDKRAAKLALYRALSEYYGIELPWGSLTGIRPVRLARQSIAERGEFVRYFTETLRVSADKTALVADILQTAADVYDEGETNVGLYAGIPFCPTRCAYCSFVSSEMKRNLGLAEAYTDALVREIGEAKSYCGRLRSVYLGGGTPVALPRALLVRVLGALGGTGAEYTVEAGRPDAIDADNMKLLRDSGVTRVCVNPQSFSDATLERIGRKHTAADTLRAYECARKEGFDINMDFIAGLPGEDFETFAAGIDRAAELRPENITVHTLCLKRGSELKEETARLAEGEAGKMVDYARRRLAAAGYAPYYLYRQKYAAGSLENVGYTLPGKACVYNVDTMEETASNVACGANAVSKRVFPREGRIERYGEPKDVKTYLEKIPLILSEKRKLFGDLCPETVYKIGEI